MKNIVEEENGRIAADMAKLQGEMMNQESIAKAVKEMPKSTWFEDMVKEKQNDYQKYGDKVYKWRRRHKKCLFCKHLSYRDLPFGSFFTCKAKDKRINAPRMRRICGLFEFDDKF